MNRLQVAAQDEQLTGVQDFIEERLNGLGFAPKAVRQVLIAAEEIFVNIAHYSGSEYVEILVETSDTDAVVSFIDGGKPYNPLEKEDPDITLAVEDRKQGGLGIYMTKKLTDGVEYSYIDGKNVLGIKKNIG